MFRIYIGKFYAESTRPAIGQSGTDRGFRRGVFQKYQSDIRRTLDSVTSLTIVEQSPVGATS